MEDHLSVNVTIGPQKSTLTIVVHMKTQVLVDSSDTPDVKQGFVWEAVLTLGRKDKG